LTVQEQDNAAVAAGMWETPQEFPAAREAWKASFMVSIPDIFTDSVRIRTAKGSLCLPAGNIRDNGKVWQEGKPRSRWSSEA